MSERPVRGSFQRRELLEHLGHLVAALAAADVDHDVRLGVLGERLLDDRLAGAEAAGHRHRAALRHREEEVEDPLAGDEGPVGGHPARHRARAAAPASAAAARARVPSSSVPTASSTVIARPPSSSATTPLTPGGTRIRCTMPARSSTVPSDVALAHLVARPARSARRSSAASRSSVGATVPARGSSPSCSARRLSGRPVPSSTEPSSPGPSSAMSGAPVASTGSSSARPVVSSNTWTVAMSPSTRITSPSRRRWPDPHDLVERGARQRRRLDQRAGGANDPGAASSEPHPVADGAAEQFHHLLLRGGRRAPGRAGKRHHHRLGRRGPAWARRSGGERVVERFLEQHHAEFVPREEARAARLPTAPSSSAASATMPARAKPGGGGRPAERPGRPWVMRPPEPGGAMVAGGRAEGDAPRDRAERPRLGADPLEHREHHRGAERIAAAPRARSQAIRAPPRAILERGLVERRAGERRARAACPRRRVRSSSTSWSASRSARSRANASRVSPRPPGEELPVRRRGRTRAARRAGASRRSPGPPAPPRSARTSAPARPRGPDGALAKSRVSAHSSARRSGALAWRSASCSARPAGCPCRTSSRASSGTERGARQPLQRRAGSVGVGSTARSRAPGEAPSAAPRSSARSVRRSSSSSTTASTAHRVAEPAAEQAQARGGDEARRRGRTPADRRWRRRPGRADSRARPGASTNAGQSGDAASPASALRSSRWVASPRARAFTSSQRIVSCPRSVRARPMASSARRRARSARQAVVHHDAAVRRRAGDAGAAPSPARP